MKKGNANCFFIYRAGGGGRLDKLLKTDNVASSWKTEMHPAALFTTITLHLRCEYMLIGALNRFGSLDSNPIGQLVSYFDFSEE